MAIYMGNETMAFRFSGVDGRDGQTSYFHLRYSNDGGLSFSTPENATYIGTYVDFNELASENVEDYDWILFKQDLTNYATKDFVNQNGGKIDKIKLNGIEIPIDTKDKSVNIEISDMNAENITYDNTTSQMTAQNVQAAIDEIIVGSTSMVTTNTTQTVSGAKTFSSLLTANAGISTVGNIDATGNITGAKVYNAVWNDYAEWFEKDNIEELFEAGDIVSWTGKGVTKAIDDDICIIGSVSDSYGHILGGKQLKDMEENKNEFVPIGLTGRVKCKVIGKVSLGDYIVTSSIPGVGKVENTINFKNIIGKALESSNEEKEKIIMIKIGV